MTSEERAPLSREAAKAQTREALVDAAMAAFAEEGLDTPSLDAICARAGYTRGAFYVHFKDRDDLVAAVMERVIGQLIEAFVASGAALDLRKTIRGFAASVAQGAFPTPSAVLSHQLMQACARSSYLRERYASLLRGAMNRVAEVARQGQAEGSLRKDVDPERLGELLVAIVLGVQTFTELELRVDASGAGASLIRMLETE